jgi:hypothetical protein
MVKFSAKSQSILSQPGCAFRSYSTSASGIAVVAHAHKDGLPVVEEVDDTALLLDASINASNASRPDSTLCLLTSSVFRCPFGAAK